MRLFSNFSNPSRKTNPSNSLENYLKSRDREKRETPSFPSDSESRIKSKITIILVKIKRRTYEIILEFFESFAQNESLFPRIPSKITITLNQEIDKCPLYSRILNLESNRRSLFLK